MHRAQRGETECCILHVWKHICLNTPSFSAVLMYCLYFSITLISVKTNTVWWTMPAALSHHMPDMCRRLTTHTHKQGSEMIFRFDCLSPKKRFDLSVVLLLRPTNCLSDSIPSRLFKEVFSAVGSFILALINTCFSSGCFPAPFKHAIVQPLIKKPSLDLSVLSNFRPISKLPFLSKVLEKVICVQLQSFLIQNDIYEKFQSGFRSCHSTETALLRVFNDLVLTDDSGCAAILVTLDLTAAFDTVDHRTL